MKKKSNKGLVGYIVVIAVFLVVALLLNSGTSRTTTVVSKRIEYPELLEMIEKDEVARVAILGTDLVGVKRGTTVSDEDFPESRYDFETTIGADFYVTVRQMRAKQLGKSLDEVSVDDLAFTIEYREAAESPWWYTYLPMIIYLLLFLGLWALIMRRQMGGSSKAFTFGKSTAKMQEPGKNAVTFADVAGCEEEKEELQEMVDFLKNPKSYTDIGARIPKGVLLVGPPGTGKTLLAKAVAGEAGVPFFSISGSDFVEMFVGVGASRVRDLFDQAKKEAPSIVFIDEIDAVGRHRGAGLGGGHDEREQTLNQLLVEMDGFAVNEGVIVMAATNRRDILDPALLRPGRFDRQVTVNYPDLEGRVAILKVHSKGKPLADDVDLENIAKRMPFATGAELENVMNEGAILAARARKKQIDHKLLIEAISRVQMGPEKKSHKVDEGDQRMVAIHEGGHAIVGHFLKGCDEVHLITVVPRGQAAGHTLALPEKEHDNMSRSQLIDQICMMLGGHAAEEVGLGEIYTGSSSDLQRATDICRKMVTQFGMSDELGTIYLANDQQVFVGMELGQGREYSEETAARIDREVSRILRECYERTRELLREHMDQLRQLTDALLKYKTIYRSEFVALMEEGRLPEGREDDPFADPLKAQPAEKTEAAAELPEASDEAAPAEEGAEAPEEETADEG